MRLQNWNDYRWILAVHRAGGLRAAAIDLDVARNTLKAHILAIEEEAGEAIFTSDTFGTHVTTFGRQIVERAIAVEDLLSGE